MLKVQNEAKLTGTERLKNSQNQYFESNATEQLAIMQHNSETDLILTQRTKIIRAETKLRTLYDRFCLKFTETVDRIRNIFINLQ